MRAAHVAVVALALAAAVYRQAGRGGDDPFGADDEPTAAAAVAAADHTLRATAATVAWGYYSRLRPPVLTVRSGETVDVELLTHHAGDYAEGMLFGDTNVEGVYEWSRAQAGLRGISGAGDGSHTLTGPIAVEGAQPGDVLAVEVVSLRPRRNPAGRVFGVSAAAWWGFTFGVNGPSTPGAGFGGSATSMGYEERPGGGVACPSVACPRGYAREVITVHELVLDPGGKAVSVEPLFSFVYGLNGSVTTPCLGHRTRFKLGVVVPCMDGVQTWKGLQFPGLVTDHSRTARTPAGAPPGRPAYSLPPRLHIGSAGLAPASPDIVESIQPMGAGGGNLDQGRFGEGATLYLRVAVDGALLRRGRATPPSLTPKAAR